MGCLQSIPVPAKEEEGGGGCKTGLKKTPEQIQRPVSPSSGSCSSNTSRDTPRTQQPQTTSPERHHHVPTESKQDNFRIQTDAVVKAPTLSEQEDKEAVAVAPKEEEEQESSTQAATATTITTTTVVAVAAVPAIPARVTLASSMRSTGTIGSDVVAASANESSRELSSAMGRGISNQDGIGEGGDSKERARYMVSVVRETVDDWNLVYEQISRPDQPNVPLIKFSLATKHTQCTVILSTDLEDEVFALYWMCPLIKVIESKRAIVSRYLAAVNFDIMLGHWDLDVRDGEVRFKVSQVVQGTRLSKDMVQQMVGVALKTFDRYFPGVMACQFGGLSAEEALIETRRLEAEADSPPPAAPQ